MTDALKLTKSELASLLCHGCKKFLSVAPIFLKNGKFFCGRCESSGDRVTIYEELAKHMTFPCIHEPCTASLKFNQVIEHEKMYCPHKIVGCPKHNCCLQYKANDLYSHFTEYHGELLCENGVQLKRTLRDMPIKKFNVHKAANLLRHQNQSYLFMIYGTCKEDPYDPGYIGSYTYSFGVFYLYKDNNTKTQFDLTATIKNENEEEETFEWRNDEIKPYDHIKHCLSCFDNSCTKGHKKNSDKFLWNRIVDYENIGQTLLLTCTVNLLDKKESQDHRSIALQNVALASKLECPVCFDFLCTPIFNCNNGHSICSKCKKRLKNCALCQAVVGNSRNYVVEEISETLEICCTNSNKGCTYIGVMKNTKNHLVNCRYNDY